MKAVILAAGEGTRLQPYTNDKPKGLVEVNGKPILTDCFEELAALDPEAFVVVVGYRNQDIIEHYGDSFESIPITYAHQRDQLGLAHAVLAAENHIDDDFILMLGDNVIRGNLGDVVARQRRSRADAALLVEEVPPESASRYGVCITDGAGEIEQVVEKPDEPPSNLVLTGFYTFSPAIFPACSLVQPSARGEYELTDAINLLIENDRTVEAIGLDGWRVDVGYPEDRERASRRLRTESEPAIESTD